MTPKGSCPTTPDTMSGTVGRLIGGTVSAMIKHRHPDRHSFAVDAECECGVKLSTLVNLGTLAQIRLAALVAAEDRFVGESGVPLDDAVSEEVEKARALLRRIDTGT
jgi:hypothetical protein